MQAAYSLISAKKRAEGGATAEGQGAARSRRRQELRSAFLSPDNVGALRAVIARQAPPPRRYAAEEDPHEASMRAYAARLLDSHSLTDPLAGRGSAPLLKHELRRANLAFCEHRLRFLWDTAAGGLGAEPLHVRMFTSDSLRPQGLEHLNGAGGSAPPPYLPEPGVDPADWATVGRPDRSPEEALAEFWGEGRVETPTTRAAAGPPRQRAPRSTRYPSIPIWQNLSRGREYDRDIEETLGAGGREHAGRVSGWVRGAFSRPRPSS